MSRQVILVTGPSDWSESGDGGLEYTMLRGVLDKAPPGSVLIHGNATGADMVADRIADSLPLFRVRVPYYGAGGRAGGPMRNAVMVQIAAGLEGDHIVYACGVEGRSSGTDDCARQAAAAGLRVERLEGPG